MKPKIQRKFDNQFRYIPPESIDSTYTITKELVGESHSEPDYYRLFFAVNGRSRLHFHNQTYPVLPGTLLLLPAVWPYSFISEDMEPFSSHCCSFQLKQGTTELIQFLQLPLFIYVQDEQQVIQWFNRMNEMQSSDLFTSRLRLKATLLELIAYFLEQSQKQQTVVSETEFDVKWNEVLLYIEANLHANIQVEELARLAFLHPNYFITSFKNMMGCSPIQYVTQRRIASAKRLLAETGLAVSEVAAQVGMQNHYLSRLFRRYTGMTPVQYRKIVKLEHRQQERYAVDLPGKGE